MNKKDKTPLNDKGRPHGKWVVYRNNDKIKYEGNLFNGLQHGKWVWYNLDGTIDMKGSFNNGNQIGYWGRGITGRYYINT